KLLLEEQMATLSPQLLTAAAQQNLRPGRKKSLSPAASLHLAGEILAVASGLKPALLYDYNSVGVDKIENYLLQIQGIGLTKHRLHLLNIADNVLILNLEKTALWLEMLLLTNKVPFIDVSASRTCPGHCEPEYVESIKGHIAEILAHVKTLPNITSQPVTTSEIFSSDWNLCTIFGVLLGYPASYTFTSEQGFDNCLSLTPLRVFTVQASCCRISKDLRVRIYSFSVPENLHLAMKEALDAWSGNLKDVFSVQNDFANLCISTEVVSLAAVAL
uniref:Chromosome 1 open reading frame 74 n=2 Tax=Gopherus evgoodei TaxID=1825980 RepID=A0A8C4VN42_9SAUR